MRKRKVVTYGVRYDMPNSFDGFELERMDSGVRFVVYADEGHIIDIREVPTVSSNEGMDYAMVQRYLDREYSLFLKIEDGH